MNVVFVAWKAARLAVLVTLVSIAVCAALAMAIALGVGRVFALALPRTAR